ncbi:MAG: DUF2268 domain-containing protein [Thermoanaerobaculia bacterium]|nr:DUF2268 domain-containing protein [Thermoanaerobaculia bacterium]
MAARHVSPVSSVANARVRRAFCGWLIVGCLVVACEKSSSPTAPANPSPSVSVVFLDATLTADQQETIRQVVVSTVERASAAIDVGALRCTVSSDMARTIPEWGLGGYALGPGDIEIVVDPEFGALDSVLTSRLPVLVAHEVHHTVRWRNPGPYGTLLDAFVFEGLADHFTVELLGAAIPPWSMALTPPEIERYLNRARPELDDTNYDFNAWFFGRGSDLPRWTGYSIGFHLVDVYLANHPGRSAASLVHEPSESFRPD